MNWKQFLKPEWKKIIIFVILLFVAPFPFIRGESMMCIQMVGADCPLSITTDFTFGVPIIFHQNQFSSATLTNVLPLFFPIHLIYAYILSCVIVWIYDRVRKK